MPDNVPLSVIFALLPNVGSFPKGRLQSLFTVLVPVLLKVTRLSVVLLQDIELLPVKLIIPEL